MTKLDKLILFARQNKDKQERRSFHVAAIYERSRLISLAFNQRKSHPKMKGFYPDHPGMGLHAEFATILNAKGLEGDYKNCTLYIARIDNNGKVAYSAPCEYCAKVIEKIGIKVIHT